MLSSNSFEEAEQAYKNKEYVKAVPIFKELCNNNNVKACRKVGEAYQYGYATHGIKDIEQASKYYEKALSILKHSCIDKKEKQACSKLGDMYGSGYVAKKDVSKAITYNKRACDLGDGDSCTRLSSIVKSKKESKKYKKKAIRMYKLSCKKGELQSCNNLGELYRKSKNWSGAFDSFSKTCASGYQYSCNNLNNMYFEINSSYMVARGLCNNHGYKSSCQQLKKMKKAKTNSFLPKIINDLKKSCTPDNQYACAALSDIASNLDFNHNTKKAKELYKFACENKYEQGCRKINNAGQGMQLGEMSDKIKPTNSDIRSYCERISGGSYVLMEFCIKKENAAKERLGY